MNYRFFVLIIFVFTFLFNCGEDNNTNPIDNKNGTVQIGSQVWMLKNLDVDHYRNGDIIPNITNPTEWRNLKTGAWCFYNNDSSVGKIYGKLYNWYAVNDPRGLAPNGWHISSGVEWNELAKYLGGISGKLKEVGIEHWKESNTDATNSSGFSALPGGIGVSFLDWIIPSSIGYYAYWWTSTSYSLNFATIIFISYNNSIIGNNSGHWNDGYSVRCVKDK